MPKNRLYGIAAGLWLSMALIAWFFAVPGQLSMANFGWINVLGLVLLTTLLAVRRSGKESRSIAGVLYDAEHPQRTDR